MDNSQKLLDKIQSEHIKQKKRLLFIAKNVFFWVLFSISILIGGAAISVIIFALRQSDFEILEHITHSRIEFFVGMLPIIWIVFSIIFLGISIWGISETKKGYKYNPLTIVSGSLLFSVLLGIVFYFSGGAQGVEAIFAKNVPGYQSVMEKKLAVWSMPQEGFLSGTIISIDDVIKLKDWDGQEWQINASEAFIRGRTKLTEGEQIKIIGVLESGNIFKAQEIRPWNGMGNNSQNH